MGNNKNPRKSLCNIILCVEYPERERERCIVVNSNLMKVISLKERVCYFKKLNNIIIQSLGVWTDYKIIANSIETLFELEDRKSVV